MARDLSSYEPVKARKKRFYTDHPDGRIIVDSVEISEEKAVFKVFIYLNKEDQENHTPRATGFALEMRDKEKKLNKYGKEYESVNFTSWTENCEESAVGRALDNAGYGSNSASKEEMKKVERMGQAYQVTINETGESILSEKQIKRLYAISRAAGVSGDAMKATLKSKYNLDSTNDLTHRQYDEICTALEKKIPK